MDESYEVAGIALAKNLDGRLELLANVYRDGRPDGFVWRRWQTLEGHWTDWESLGKPGEGAQLPPGVARNDDGRLEAAVVDLQGHMHHTWQRYPGRLWTGWQAMTTPGEQILFSSAQPAFARNRDGRLELFAKTRDGAVWHRWQTTPAHGPWSPWSSLGDPDGNPHDRITAVRNQDGHLEIFAVGGPGSGVFHRWQTRPGSDQWSAWSPLDAPAPPRGAIALLFAPAVARDHGGRLELLARGEGGWGGMWHRRQSEASHGPWSQWSPLGQPDGEYHGPITVGAHADGRLVLAVGMHVPDDIPASQVKPVSLLEQTTPSGDWSQWRSFHTPGPYETTDPVLALDADQRLQVWLRIPGTTNLFMLRQNRPNGDEWHGGETEIKPSPEPSERWPPSDPPH